MAESKYYDIHKILDKKDLEGKEPSIYMITSNRSGGKTTSTLKYSLELFKNNRRKTILLYRHKYELNGANLIYKDVLNMYSEYGEEMTILSHSGGTFYELFLDGTSFGYAVSLSNPDVLKKYSPLFADVDIIIMDEFQKEDGKYLNKEVEKLQSVYLTVARGGGEQSRQVKVFLLGNMVSLMNPYFVFFGIHKRLRDNTKFIRGNGWVAQFTYIESASKSIQNNGFFRAFKDESYMNYSVGDNVYLYDSRVFIEQPKGKSKYLFTIIHDKTAYAVREFFNDGIVYVSKKIDPKCKMQVTFKANDHTQNTMMLNHYCFLWKNIKDAYQQGYLRFDDIKSKNAIFDILGVDLYK